MPDPGVENFQARYVSAEGCARAKAFLSGRNGIVWCVREATGGFGNIMSSALGISPKQAAQRLGKDIKTLWLWRKNGNGPPYRVIGSRIHYPEDMLASYIEKNTRGG